MATASSHGSPRMSNLEPLGSRILVRPIKAPDKIGSIWIVPATQDEFRISQAEVVARGNRVQDDRLQPGLRIICRRFGKTEISGDLAVVHEWDVLAIVA